MSRSFSFPDTMYVNLEVGDTTVFLPGFECNYTILKTILS